MNPRRHQFRTVEIFLLTVVVALVVVAVKEVLIYGTTISSILLLLLAGVLGAATARRVSQVPDSYRRGFVAGLSFGVLGLYMAVLVSGLRVRLQDKVLVIVCVCGGGIIGGLIPPAVHKWRQASIRSRRSILMVGLATLVIVTVFTAIREGTVRKQAHIVAKLERAGARIEYDDVNPFPMLFDSNRMYSRYGYEWLRKWLGLRVVTRVLLTEGPGWNATSVDLGSAEDLARMPLMEELALHANRMDDDDIVTLLNSGQLAKLKWLRINGRQFNDDLFSQLNSLPSIELLDLRGTSISDESVEHIATLPRLQLLDIRETGITAAGIKLLKSKVPSCRVVSSK